MKILDLLYPQNKVVSIVGTSKNAGKTVTLNEIIKQADEQGVVLGLISTGRDGERRDVLTETEKPAIYVKRGTILTTVEQFVQGVPRAEAAGIEILSVTEYNTPMGRVILGRARDNGFVEIAGPHSSASIKKLNTEMLDFGAQLILVDGSLDRRASAAPFLSDSTVIAAGAALSRNMNIVLDNAMHLVSIYGMPSLERAEERDMAHDMIDMGKTALVDEDGRITYIEAATSLKCGDAISEKLSEETRLIVLSGSATFDTLRDILLNKKSSFTIVVKDPTRIFLSSKELQLLKKLGLELRTVQSIQIASITINPYSPEGYFFDPVEFLARMRSAIPHIPVFDVVLGDSI